MAVGGSTARDLTWQMGWIDHQLLYTLTPMFDEI